MKMRVIFATLLILEGVLLSYASASGKYYNTPCQADSDCGLENSLQCINNYCQCDTHSQIYDQSTNKCLLLLGQECQSPAYTVTSHGHYEPDLSSPPPIKCVPHADCTKSICRCKEGYRPSLDLLCKPDFGSPCHTKEDCDESLGLVCTQGVCQCFNTTWSYQGQFGCVDPQDPTYNEMLRLLNQTHHLLKENDLEIKDMFNELGLQNDPNSEYVIGNAIADERQFRNNYNSNQDLQFAAQNQSPQQSNGFNLQQLLSLFQTLQQFIPRQNNNNNNNGSGGGGGNNNGGAFGFLRTLANLFGGNQGGGGGYPDSSSPSPGYGAPGSDGMGQRMGLINSFLNLFNQLIPVVRQLKMRFSPIRFLQNLVNRFAPSSTEPAPPPPQSIRNPPPNVIQSSGNYNTNPIFENNNPNAGQQNNQGQGSFRFFMRSRDRFRGLLNGNNNNNNNNNNNQGGNGGYNYSPPTSFGTPSSGQQQGGNQGAPPSFGTPSRGQQQSGNRGPPPENDDNGEGAGSSNFYSNNAPPPAPGTYRVQQQEFNTITIGVSHSGGAQKGSSSSSSSSSSSATKQSASQRHVNRLNSEGQQNHDSSSSQYNSGHHPNPQSFFGSSSGSRQQQSNNHYQTQHHSAQPHQQFQNNQLQHTNSNSNNNNNYHAQATSHHHHTTYVPHAQQQSSAEIQPTPFQRPPPPNEPPSIYSNGNLYSSSASQTQSNHNNNRPPSILASAATPPPIPQFKLPVPSQKNSATVHESLVQNYILSEADDPHPGFTPHSSSAPELEQEPKHSYRQSARFERIGEEDNSEPSAADNWRESF